MSARSVGLGAMFGWVGDTFGLVKRNFGAMSVASLLTIVAGVLFALPILYVMFKSVSGGGVPSPANPLGMDMQLFYMVYAGTIVASLLLFPPLLAGWFRLCESADRGANPSGASIFGPYAESTTWLRLVGFALVAMLMYIVALGLLWLVFGSMFGKLIAMQAAQQAAVYSGQPPPPPDMALVGQLLLSYVVILPLMFLLQFVYMVGLAEVSLRSTPVLVAFKEALAGVLRNSLKLLLFMFCLFVAFMILAFILGLVLALVIGVLAMLSKTLMAVAIIALYIPILLVAYPLIFAGNYLVWKSMLGGESSLVPAVDGSVAA